MSSDYVAMQFDGDAPGLYQTEQMPSGNVYQYSSMAGRNQIMVDPRDAKDLEKAGFSKVEAPKQEVTRIAEADKEAEQAEQASESADEPKANRRK